MALAGHQQLLMLRSSWPFLGILVVCFAYAGEDVALMAQHSAKMAQHRPKMAQHEPNLGYKAILTTITEKVLEN